ncbi:MAG TPA: hypothetical protein VFX30_04145 [bacterium]|nr:hypothetical protein [bacterium]
MNRRLRFACLLSLVFLAGSLETPARAEQGGVEEAPKESSFTYDRKTGLFVRVRPKRHPSFYRAGDLNVNVGYAPRVSRPTEETLPPGVERFLFKRTFP